jgi:hypothetical protein
MVAAFSVHVDLAVPKRTNIVEVNKGMEVVQYCSNIKSMLMIQFTFNCLFEPTCKVTLPTWLASQGGHPTSAPANDTHSPS